jgi:hypothetical protein
MLGVGGSSFFGLLFDHQTQFPHQPTHLFVINNLIRVPFQLFFEPAIAISGPLSGHLAHTLFELAFIGHLSLVIITAAGTIQDLAGELNRIRFS